MKPYFAKYLPKPGGYSRVVKNAEGIPIDHETEVQLFLCLRDIKELDYKVMGPISPAATWVKEGDEFEENELAVLEWGGSSVRKHINMVDFSELEVGDKYPKIFIKGPCGHLH